MLAQTQVARVIPKWEEFLAAGPTRTPCARAPVGEVIAAWNGLGYNRRAVLPAPGRRSLSPPATRVSVPADRAALTCSARGSGAYTARAVLAFAFDHPVGVVETNTARVLARAVAGRRLSGGGLRTLADSMVPPAAGLGLESGPARPGCTGCTARGPTCGACPLGTGQPGHRPVCAAGPGCRPSPTPPPAPPAPPVRNRAFDGSDRQGRGRLLAWLTWPAATGRAGSDPGPRHVGPDGSAAAAGWPHDPDRALVAARSLVADGLAEMAADGSPRYLAEPSGIGHTDGIGH